MAVIHFKFRKMYERSLNQILQVLRRIKCLTYAMFLITSITLVLYLVRDFMTVNIISQQTIAMRGGLEHAQYRRRSEGPGRDSRYRRCQPEDNIIFTKTHKTGSSTITNILLRYGEVYNKTQLLYKYPSSTEYKRLQDHRLMAGRPTANIFSQHATFNASFLDSHIASPAKRFTILRSPVSQFISGFSFFEKTKVYPADTFEESVKLFFRSHGKYLKETWFCKNCGNLVNANSVDMGLSLEQYVKAGDKGLFMKEFLERSRQYYDLVLITEYFDLALVLLKRRLCLEYEDILYLRSLERIRKDVVEEPYTIAKIVEIQKLDIQLYEYFNKTFWREVEKEDGIFEELEIFQKLNKQVQEFCVKGTKPGYQGTYENVLSDQGRKNFQCLAMNTRCLPFSGLLECRDDEGVTHEQFADLLETSSKDKDNLSLSQLIHMNRHENVIDLSYRNRFK